MKHRTHFAARTALALAAVAALGGWPTESSALGLGRLSVQSALGESMRAEIDITNLTPEEAASLSVRVASPEAYRSAGVEYNNVLSSAQVTVARRPDGRPYLLVSSARAVQEPFLEVILEMNWASGRLVREYTLLFDPPGSRIAPPALAAAPTAPVIAAAPVSPPRVAATPLPRAEPSMRPPPPAARPAPAPAPRVVARTPAPPPVAARPAPRPAPVARPAPPRGDYTVRRGDTLSEIALSRRFGGVSLDQMLVGLYRANPDAFVNGNMNRLMAGAVLSMPDADSVRSVDRAEARRVIVAQSRDFDAYRARLAGRVPRNTAEDDTDRRAKGTVQAAVEDRKQDAAASPDRLTLSAGGVKASEAAARVAAENERKAAAERAAELKRNVDDLKKLQGSSAPTQVADAAKAAAAGATAAVAAAGDVAGSAARSVADGVAAAADAASQSISAVVPPVMQAPAASVAPPFAPPPAPAPTPAPAPPPVAQAAPAAPSAEAPGFLDGIISSPWLLPGAGILAVLLAGFGAWRLRSRMQKSPSETSFLESRMQPDSFFGASGGQRVDTQDANSGAASSMGYSLSQIDAIGDVDPVAEADVYLAYGRDLQAEEILKEAMRSSPERLAVRTKLLEVYAKRRDTKGFEMLAAQLFALTKGEGNEWERAQEMGLQIDPENPMYQPGGRPTEVTLDGDRVVPEPLSATTLPHQMTQMPPAAQDSLPSDLDLDLDLSDERPTAGRGLEATQPMPGQGMADLSASGAATTAQNSSPGTFDPLSLDLSPPSESPASTLAAGARKVSEPFPRTSQGNLEGPTSPGELDGLPDDGDPLARKLELAEEFRQIGDVEGARDLITEVLEKADGVLKAKAQSMLDALS